jgi:molybdenum cofactor cytidylyltransferase
MIALERTVAILLCAGESRRFGDADKLLHPLAGKPLVLHVAEALAALPFQQRLATVRPDAHVLHGLLKAAGFALRQTAPGATQADSLQSGLDAALALKPEAILLALGDMPFVGPAHILALAQAANAIRPAVSQGADWISPPWIAATAWLRANQSNLKAALQRDAVTVRADGRTLHDIDRPEDV